MSNISFRHMLSKMINSLTPASLKVKVLFPTLVIQVILISSLVYMLIYLQVSKTELKQFTEHMKLTSTHIAKTIELQNRIEMSVISYQVKKDPYYLEDIENNVKEINVRMLELEELNKSDDWNMLKGQFETCRKKHLEDTEMLIQAINTDDPENIDRVLAQWQASTDSIDSLLNELTDYNLLLLENNAILYDDLITSINRIIALVMLGTIVVIVALYIFLRNSITKPIESLSEATKRISAGDFNLVSKFKSKDEIGELTDNINLMSRSLEANYQKLQTEIHEKERALEKSRELEQRKDEFISMASHELKTPITSIKLFTQVLDSMFTKKGEKEPLKYINRMNEQIDRLTSLLNDLLDVSRIQTGRLSLRKKYFSLHKLVEETAENINSMESTHMIKITGKTKNVIYADQDRIGQVLINLINNAIKYSPNADLVLIDISSNKDSVIVAVRDYGIGIEKSFQSKIFDRFYRVYDNDDKTFPGFGIGLYISSEIINRHKGKIWVESEKGIGAVFYFKLPKHGMSEEEI